MLHSHFEKIYNKRENWFELFCSLIKCLVNNNHVFIN